VWAFSLKDQRSYAWLHGSGDEFQGQLAPRTKDPWWMAYVSNESGQRQVYLESFTLDGHRRGRVLVSLAGGIEPRWRGDGRELYYVATDGKMMVVDVRADFAIGPPRELFTMPSFADGSIYLPHRYDVTRDGQRFVIATRSGEPRTAPLSVIVNWQQQLGR
jgi:hypothetical protein